MNINTIYAAGITIVTSSPAYDPTQQSKNWVRPLQSGDDPTDDYSYQTAEVDNTVPAPYVTWHTKGISKGDAAVANLAPTGYVPPAGVTETTGAVAIPMDQSLIPAGYTLTGTPFGLSLVASAAASATASEEDRILQGVEEILASEGKPAV